MAATLRHRDELLRIKEILSQSVLGNDRQAELLLVGLLAKGHVLIQGAPGLGKTSLAKSMAASIGGEFKRIQFTPDLLPADILGYSIYNQGSHTFNFHKGAVFTNILLADEINRTTPRIQSALLEAMNEAQVSIDGKTYELDPPFFVVATRNHLYSSGTFPLPDSQLDRFLLSFGMERPDTETQVNILKLHMDGGEPSKSIDEILTKAAILESQSEVEAIEMDESVMHYIAALSDATHESSSFASGASPRAAISLMKASQAFAWLDGRTHVYPDDVKETMPYVFQHRIHLKHRFRKSGETVRQHLGGILNDVAVP